MQRQRDNQTEIEMQRDNQRISMRTSLEVLISADLIVKASIMQRKNDSVSVSVCNQEWSRSCIRHSSHMMIITTAEIAGKRTVGKISPKIRTAVTEIKIAITGLGTSLSRKIGRASLAPAETPAVSTGKSTWQQHQC